ncbi:unnamed protein product [Polarella glacialis]|uniref:Uncharacterized protein n=1 Tax=Polarella glacialis TaxID=89957 RepID=A0A813JKU8_POLGL|nr:unnamed protein product [Polarella glacialis]CAE8679640.1 unnamed protein product [Polarella glacialis]
MGCSSSVADQVQTVEVEVWHDETAEYNQAMMRSSTISRERERQHNSNSNNNTSKTLGSTFAPSPPDESGDLYLDFSVAPSKSQGADLAVELAAMSEEVEADQAEGKDVDSWHASSHGKRNHVSHEVKLNAFLQSFAPDDMEEKVKQLRKRDAAKSALLKQLISSSARPQIFRRPDQISEDSFNSSESQASPSADN